MSGIAFVGGLADSGAAHLWVQSALGAMSSRGGQISDIKTGERTALGFVRHGWEADLIRGLSSGVASDSGHSVAADATLYHIADLRSSIIRPEGNTACQTPHEPTRQSALQSADSNDPAGLILAALQSFGESGVSRLEGDFAFVAWNESAKKLTAARDFGGKRPLYWSNAGGIIRIASTIDALLTDSSLPRDIDLATVGSVAAGLWGHGPYTAYQHIRELPAGHILTWEPGTAPTVREFWTPPTRTLTRRPSQSALDEATEELKRLLALAVSERLAPSGPTGVTLSGGWDSTAVYGTAHNLLRTSGDSSRSIFPVSIGYPEGDPGREDEIIQDVVAHWNDKATLIDVDSLPIFHNSEADAAKRPQPFKHTYEEWNRSLSRTARSAGAHVILDGIGGDQLFQTSAIYLADLFRSGQWFELKKQADVRSGGRVTLRELWQWAVKPALPPSVVRLIASARRLPAPSNYLERHPPFWFNRGAMEATGVFERERSEKVSLPRGSNVVAETHAYLRYPFYPRVFSHLFSFGIDEGVELRSPLLDERVVRFAISRPWCERADLTETKILLRRAMRGLLPDSVIAPRTHRTGVTSAYFLRQIRGPGYELAQRIIPKMQLAELGMIDSKRYERAWEHILKYDDDETAGRVFFTLQAELWLRGRLQ